MAADRGQPNRMIHVSARADRGRRRNAKYERLIARAKAGPPATTIVVHPCDETSLRGAVEAARSRHHRSDPGRAGGEDRRRGARSTVSTSAGFEIVDVAAQRRGRGERRSN